MAGLKQLWAERSDEALEEAAENLLEYTEEGQRVIREELQQRSIEVPAPKFQSEEASEVLEEGVPIYSGPRYRDVAALQGTLKSHEIACEIRNSQAGPLTNRPWPELWILDESRAGEARQLVEVALDEARRVELDAEEGGGEREENTDRGLDAEDERPEESASWSWTCPGCGEDVENHFWECWNCGCDRPQ